MKKHSGPGIAAFIISVATWIYCLALWLGSGLIGSAIAAMQCSRQDFGACALQNLFSAGFALILILIAYFVVPFIMLGVSLMIGLLAMFQIDRNRRFAIISLIANTVLIFAALCFFAFL